MGAALALVPFLKGWPPGQALRRQCARVRRRVLVPEEVDAVGAHLANVLARARVGRLALPPAASLMRVGPRKPSAYTQPGCSMTNPSQVCNTQLLKPCLKEPAHFEAMAPPSMCHHSAALPLVLRIPTAARSAAESQQPPPGGAAARTPRAAAPHCAPAAARRPRACPPRRPHCSAGLARRALHDSSAVLLQWACRARASRAVHRAKQGACSLPC